MISLLLRSRTACALVTAAALLGGFFVWHTLDRSSAVRRAVSEFVAETELTVIRAQLTELQRRQAIADHAKRRLQSEIEEANALAEAAVEELEHYVSTVEDTCVVRSDLLERLRDR